LLYANPAERGIASYRAFPSQPVSRQGFTELSQFKSNESGHRYRIQNSIPDSSRCHHDVFSLLHPTPGYIKYAARMKYKNQEAKFITQHRQHEDIQRKEGIMREGEMEIKQ
jgi:hypothetical protein